MRNRKGRSGQRGEDNSPRADSKDVSGSPASPAGGTLLWILILLLLAGGGIGGWFIQQQLSTIDNLDHTIQILQKKLSQLEMIQDQVGELNEKLLITETHEQRLQDLEVTWTNSKRKLDQAAEAVAQIQSANLNSKVTGLQLEMSTSLSELRKDLLKKNDLKRLEDMVEVLREVDLAQAEQQVARMKAVTTKLEENTDSLSTSLTSLTSRMASLEAARQDLQSVEDINTIKELMNYNLHSISNSVTDLTIQVNQTTQATDAILTQLARQSNELSELKNYASFQQVEHLASKEQLEDVRKMGERLQKEKISMEELESAVRSTVVVDLSELQKRTGKMDEILANLQVHVAKVESNGADQNKQLADALNQTSHTLQNSLGKIETNLKSSVEQCLSGEVRTFCETLENCAWPHIREVNFPHRILKDPVIILSLAEISSVESVGVTVKTVDVTDSGFKIQINSIGNYNLSTVRVNWMLCA
ncbi:myosin-15-like [Leucoraja erinacea]|uniref:myosin-15-like n=1 Tax=Leucoraja erinaceus TaxID=7782 RepID=UPI0024572665|nr:myosin-15-like [Leucoraja erinacea]